MKFSSQALIVLASLVSSISYANSFNLTPFPYKPRITGWAAEGSYGVAQGDFMLPVAGNDQMNFFGDAQAKFATTNDWFGGIGIGGRSVYHGNRIFGAYGFVDRSLNKNNNTSSEAFWIFNPGVESLGEVWDFRINGYIPVSSQSINSGSVYVNEEYTNIENAQFIGHEEYSQIRTTFNHSGPGIDGEVGYLVPIVNLRVFAGGYHFSPQNDSNINGVSARMEYAFNHYTAITANYTYDNDLHSRYEIGIRLTMGGINDDQSSKDIERRLMDPVSRNLATISQGTSVPITTTQELANHGGYFLERNNIYFFTTNSDKSLTYDLDKGVDNCTFEHPCDDRQFSQKTINNINKFATHANLYFEPGTYNLKNNQLIINNGQSLYGRTVGFRAPASGASRATFLGSMPTILSGNNRLDSIRLLHNVVDNTGVGSQVVALNIQNADNVTLNNIDVQVSATETADLTANHNNFATAIYANKSSVTIINSNISATAQVNGNNYGNNFASAVGVNTDGDSPEFANNNFTFNNSTINSTATVQADNNASNFAVAIGGNSNTGSTNFNNNSFHLTQTTVNSAASTGGNDNSLLFASGIGGNTLSGSSNFIGTNIELSHSTINSTSTINGSGSFITLASGIGGNGGAGAAATNFNNSKFDIKDSAISGATSVVNNDTGFNFGSGIGGNGTGAADFNNSNFNITNSTIKGSAYITGNSNNLNYATGIGGNNSGGHADFNGNHFNINNSEINGDARVYGNHTVGVNIASGIGGNSTGGTTANFLNNIISITGGKLSSIAFVGNNNVGSINSSTGINMNGAGNSVNISQMIMGVLTQINGYNTGSSTSLALNAGSTSTINIADSTVNILAAANGVHTATATTGMGTFNTGNTQFNISP